MKFALWFEWISNATDTLSRILLAVFMALMVADVLLGVFNRFLFKLSISWTEELARFLMIWVSMLGAAIALKKGAHVSITFCVNRFGGFRHILVWINFLILAVFLLFVCLFGFKLCFSQAAQLSPVLRLSMRWPLSAIPTGCLIMMVHILAAFTSRSRLMEMSGFPVSEIGEK